jgi:hypothetical protein
MKIRLPTGGTLVPAIDPSPDASSDCSKAFALLPAVTSYIASTQCLVKVLELVGPLTEIVRALSNSPEVASSAAKFLRIAQQLIPCEVGFTNPGVLPFARDVSCLLLLTARCVMQQLKTLGDGMKGLAGQLSAAQAARNTELVKQIEEAMQRAQTQATALLGSYAAILSLSELASTYLRTAGILLVQFPMLPATADSTSIEQLFAGLQNSVASLQATTDALGGCS